MNIYIDRQASNKQVAWGMERGYIKLWRKSMDSRIFANKSLWQLWTYCLMRGNHGTEWVSIQTGRGETEVEIKSGQMVFGRKTWAKKLKTKPSTLWEQMLKLKRLGYLDIQSGSHCSVVTIINWGHYQQKENEKEQPNGQATKNQPKTNQKSTGTDKNDKNDKKVLKEDIYSCFDFWNSLNIIQHRNVKSFESCINASLEHYKIEEIKEAMQNYKDIISSDKYYFNHSWALNDFLTRKGGLDKFLTINKPFETYKAWEKNNDKQKPSSKFTGLDEKNYHEGAF